MTLTASRKVSCEGVLDRAVLSRVTHDEWSDVIVLGTPRPLATGKIPDSEEDRWMSLDERDRIAKLPNPWKDPIPDSDSDRSAVISSDEVDWLVENPWGDTPVTYAEFIASPNTPQTGRRTTQSPNPPPLHKRHRFVDALCITAPTERLKPTAEQPSPRSRPPYAKN